MGSVWQFLINELFPSRCITCHKPSDALICPACQKEIFVYYGENTQLNIPNYLTLFKYSDQMHKILEELKFKNNQKVLPILQKALAVQAPAYQVDYIIPVPLNPLRLKQRGFNQAEELIKLYAQIRQIPIRTDLIYRQYNTLPSYQLDKQQRQTQSEKAFAVWPDKKLEIANKRILIFDDIITTGSTIKNILAVLAPYQPKEILILGLARPLAK